MPRDRRRAVRRAAIAGASLALLFAVACWPTSRFVGTNFVVTRQTLPLWLKAVDFIDRDLNVARTAQAVISEDADDEAKAAAALTWTRASIRPQPSTLPVVDDHIWHIIVRGYGLDDQRADVFTTILVYAGVPAYWMLIGGSGQELALSYVRIRDAWRVYDVTNGVVFRHGSGELATPEQLAGNRELITTAAHGAGLQAERYLEHFAGYRPPQAPDVLRADMQMPRRRAWQEVRRVMRMPAREWQMRPDGLANPKKEHE